MCRVGRKTLLNFHLLERLLTKSCDTLLCVHLSVCSATVGKADTSAALMAQQAADIGSEKVSAQPNPLAATYNIGIISLRSLTLKLLLAMFEIWPSLLSHSWLGVRKSIRPVKNGVMRCWCGYLSGARCRLFAYGPAYATASQNPIISCLI